VTAETKKSGWFVRSMWHAYGYTYDGLRYFYPYQQLIRQVAERLELSPGLRVLEIGCGTGNVLEIALQTPEIHGIGVDMSASMLAVARRKLRSYIAKGQLDLVQQDIEVFLKQLPSSSIDRIVSVNVFYALGNRAVIWSELMRVLGPQGRMVITSSVRTGSGPIIKEHLKNASWLRLFQPKLLGVFIIDTLINLIGDTGHFAFPDERVLREEVEKAGGVWVNPVRCYGGVEEGVNVLFTVLKPQEH